MVPRYSRPEMTAIWSAENRYLIWWQIEVLAGPRRQDDHEGSAGVVSVPWRPARGLDDFPAPAPHVI